MKEISVEVFVAPGCFCSHESTRRQFERIAKQIEEKHNVEVNISYLPVIAKRARELGVSRANTVVVEDELVLEENYSAADVQKKIDAVVKASKTII